MSYRPGEFRAATDFPKVILIRNIPNREHPLARYLKGSKTIELAAEELRKHEPEARRFAVYHELGHFWRTSVLGISEGGPDEEFADDFANYFLKPSALNDSPDVLRFSGRDSELLETFAEDVVRKLEAGLWRV